VTRKRDSNERNLFFVAGGRALSTRCLTRSLWRGTRRQPRRRPPRRRLRRHGHHGVSRCTRGGAARRRLRLVRRHRVELLLAPRCLFFTWRGGAGQFFLTACFSSGARTSLSRLHMERLHWSDSSNHRFLRFSFFSAARTSPSLHHMERWHWSSSSNSLLLFSLGFLLPCCSHLAVSSSHGEVALAKFL